MMNNNSQFDENLMANKHLNQKLSKKQIKKLIDDKDELKKIEWIYKNKID